VVEPRRVGDGVGQQRAEEAVLLLEVVGDAHVRTR
jgi:hypothetical protein